MVISLKVSLRFNRLYFLSQRQGRLSFSTLVFLVRLYFEVDYVSRVTMYRVITVFDFSKSSWCPAWLVGFLTSKVGGKPEKSSKGGLKKAN